MVKKRYCLVFLIISHFLTAGTEYDTILLPFSGESEAVPWVEDNFTEQISKNPLFNILKRDEFEFQTIGNEIMTQDSYSKVGDYTAVGELTNAHYIISGHVSVLEEKYYLQISLFSVETSEIVISKISDGFLQDEAEFTLTKLITNVSVESGIRKKPPSILNPMLLDFDMELRLITGDIGYQYKDPQIDLIMDERILINLAKNDIVIGLFEVVEVQPDTFTAEMKQGDFPSDIGDESYSLGAAGKRMPWSIGIGTGFDGGVLLSLGVSYTSQYGIGSMARLSYSNRFMSQSLGTALYGAYTIGIRKNHSFRFGLGAEYTAPAPLYYIDRAKDYQFYPSGIIQYVTPGIGPYAFGLSLKYNHYGDITAYPMGAPMGILANLSLDLSYNLHPGFWK
jgi:hypothetical protein